MGWSGGINGMVCAEQVRMPNSRDYQPVECCLVVNAAGAFSAKLAAIMGVGLDPEETVAGIPVPVEPRKRWVTGSSSFKLSGFLFRA